MDKAQRALLLAGLDFSPTKTPSQAKPPSSALSPTKRKVRYLPGETRAACGIDGFREMDTRTYRRRLYANANPRNLTPPQFLHHAGGTASERKTEHVVVGSDPHYPKIWRDEKARLTSECAAEKYIERFLLSLLTARYRSWRIGGWVWREFTPNPLITSTRS